MSRFNFLKDFFNKRQEEPKESVECMNKSPLITIVAVDYDQWVPREGAKRGMKSLENQTMKDFEVLFFHDGPRTYNVKEQLDLTNTWMDITYANTHTRFNMWGHPQRHLGVQMARGQYILHFNCDNYLEPDALEKIKEVIDTHNPNAIVCSIRWNGHYFPGVPVHPGNIDCLQMVAKKSVWEEIGGWYQYDGASDGPIYKRIDELYGHYHLDYIIGDNYISRK